MPCIIDASIALVLLTEFCKHKWDMIHILTTMKRKHLEPPKLHLCRVLDQPYHMVLHTDALYQVQLASGKSAASRAGRIYSRLHQLDRNMADSDHCISCLHLHRCVSSRIYDWYSDNFMVQS